MVQIKQSFNNLVKIIKETPKNMYEGGCKVAFVLPVLALTHFNFEKGRDIANNIQHNLLQNYEGSTNFYGKAIEYVLEKPHLSDLILLGVGTALILRSAKIANKYNPIKICVKRLKDGVKGMGSAYLEVMSGINGEINNTLITGGYKSNLEEKVKTVPVE